MSKHEFIITKSNTNVRKHINNLADIHEIGRYVSNYETIIIEDKKGVRHLHFNSAAIQTMMSLDDDTRLISPTLEYLMGVLLYPIPFPNKYLIAGVGGGALVRYIRAYFPESMVDCVDHDQTVLEVANRYFGLPASSEKQRYFINDAAIFLTKTSDRSYDTLLLNLHDADGTPDFMLSEEFYLQCRRCLSEQGILSINVIVKNRSALVRLLMSVRKAFDGRCLCVNIPQHENIAIYAFKNKPTVNCSTSEISRKAKELAITFDIDFPAMWESIFSFNPNLDREKKKENLWDIIP